MLSKRWKSVIVLPVILGACAVPPMAARTPAAQPVQAAASTTNDDATLLRELALRIAGPGMFGPGNTQAVEPELVIGKMPSVFPKDIPIPDGARVLGGITRGEGSADLIVDATQAPDVAVKLVSDGLKAKGWSVPPNMNPGGFMAAAGAMGMVCQSKSGPLLYLTAQRLKRGVTDLRYSLNSMKDMPFGATGPCDQPTQMGIAPQTFPPLVTPEGAVQSSSGAGGGPNSQLQFATLQTDQNVRDLLDQYGQQLTKAGWAQTGSGGDTTMAWSKWQVKSASDSTSTTKQDALLFVVDSTQDKPQRFVQLQMTFAAR